LRFGKACNVLNVQQNSKEKPAAFYALVRGRVQGVGFRYSTQREAQRLRLKGWVRNTIAGDVELWAEGPREKLEVFYTWLRRGPQLSRVDSVNLENKNPVGYEAFEIKH
jgi:acylphosphatase